MSYVYTVSRLRGMENHILDTAFFSRLMDSAGIDEALRALGETGYSQWISQNGSSFDKAIDSEMLATFQELETFVPDKGLIDIFRLPYDFHNVKVLLKGLFKVRGGELDAPTSAQLRRGASFGGLRNALVDFADSGLKLSVLELQDETADDLLKLLKPLCIGKSKAPVVCLDYLQIVPTERESPKLGIDDAVRKLKKFQRDTNTTFIVISSFNRTNYAQAVSFESFKESGNIEYTADVVWALQLNLMNEIKSGALASESRQKIDEAKKQQPRQIQLKCLKNRQGTNYDCFFNYHSAHDCFEPCAPFNEKPDKTNLNDELLPP